MKKTGLFLLAVVMVVGMAGCPGGGGDDDYNFNGIWLMQEQIVSEVCAWQAVSGRVQIVQDGNNLTWQFIDAGSPARPGSCDPGNGSLYVNYTSSDGTAVTINGLAVDKDTITGTWGGYSGWCSFSSNITLELISR